jgi:solute carrier family 25 protein 42
VSHLYPTGAVSKTVIAPADRVKIMFQVDPKKRFTFASAWTCLKHTYTTEGTPGLWRGNGAMMPRVFISAGISYMSFDRYEVRVSAFTALIL